MPRQEYVLSGYRGMWLFAMFDLPVTTKNARKRYAQFRKLLLEDGFSMLQYSVYARYCASEEMALAHRDRVRCGLPSEGYVRLLAVTDRQFGKMESYFGEKRQSLESAPSQLVLF
jgi:CRISPR-associated protein Cas2